MMWNYFLPLLPLLCTLESSVTLLSRGYAQRSTPTCYPYSLSPLYNAALDKADYYDTSANTTEIGTNSGLPYGFFHHPMEGLPDGYPVLVSAAISMRRALQTLQYIQYGGFLNRAATDTLTLKMVMYNPAAIVFGYYSAALRWLASGEVAMTVSMQVRGPCMHAPSSSFWGIMIGGEGKTFSFLAAAMVVLGQGQYPYPS